MFSITMISFGVSHFYYTKTVEDMVPEWIPSHLSGPILQELL
jgi:hypothetical protein